MSESNRGTVWRGVLVTVVVAALVVGVVSPVTASSVTTYDNETNTTYVVSNATNDSTGTNDSGYSVASTSNETDGPATVHPDDTDNVSEGTENELTSGGLALDGTDRIERFATEDSRLLEVLDRTGPGIDTLARGTPADNPEREAAGETDRKGLSGRLLDAAQSTIEPDDPATDDSADADPGGPAFEDAGVSANGEDTSRPLAGVVVGLQAVVAGVAVRELTDLQGPARSVAVTGRQMVDRVPRLFAPLRYSRYDDSDPLEHDDRATVFETIDDSPGVYLSELSEQTGVSLSTLRHHVRVLEQEDLIVAARVRGRRRFYPAHTEDVELAAAMNDEATAPIVDALGRLGAMTVSDLADEDGRDASTVTHHLQRLEDDGLVEREREGRAILNRLAAEVREALAPLGETSAELAEAEATVSAD